MQAMRLDGAGQSVRGGMIRALRSRRGSRRMLRDSSDNRPTESEDAAALEAERAGARVSSAG